MASCKPSEQRIDGTELGVGLFGDQLGDLDFDGERFDDLCGGRRDTCGTDDRCYRGEYTADPVAVDAEIRCGLEVQDVRDRWGIECHQRGYADECQCFRVEA